ncbi:MAG: hypothetical protein HY763_08790 [Planctomycetes bacterium]|nr:hypothetical protein [Planctomycetota bacterium]
MRSILVLLTVTFVFAGTTSVVRAQPQVILQPVSSTGPYTIAGQEISLPDGGVEVTFEVLFAGWGHVAGTQLRTAYAGIDPAGYLGANADPPWTGIDLTPKGYAPPDPTGGTRAGGFFQTTTVCATSNRDCSPGQPACAGGEGACVPNPRFFLSCCNPTTLADTSTLAYRLGAESTMPGAGADDPGAPSLGYAGTLIVQVPANARATYSIGFDADPAKTFVRDQADFPIENLSTVGAVIHIVTGRCCFSLSPGEFGCEHLTEPSCNQLPRTGPFLPGLTCWDCGCAECHINSNCMDYICRGGPNSGQSSCYDCSPGICVPNLCISGICNPTDCCDLLLLYDPTQYCCDPTVGPNGGLTALSDGNQCTDDICDAGTGTVTHPQRTGQPCDDGRLCSINDTCDAANQCSGTDIITVPCTTDADCGVFECNVALQRCRCVVRQPYDFFKNRYVYFTPGTGAQPAEFRVVRRAPSPPGHLGWVSAPNANSISRIVPNRITRVWTESIVYVGDCEVMPEASYEFWMSTDGGQTSTLVRVAGTARRPTPKFWGDTVGNFDGLYWSGPNGVVNTNDFVAALKRFQSVPAAPHLTTVDVQAVSSTDPCLNEVVNIADVFLLLKAFQGDPYPFTTDPATCPPCP